MPFLSALMVRSRAISAFTRVFDALWRGVSNHGHTLRTCRHPSRRPSFARAPQDEGRRGFAAGGVMRRVGVLAVLTFIASSQPTHAQSVADFYRNKSITLAISFSVGG